MRKGTRGALCVAAVLACQPWGTAQEAGPELRRTESKPEAEMLAHANLYRSGLDLPLLTRDPELSVDCLRHALYMDRNNKTGHPEDPSLPGYHPKGHAAGMASIIAYTQPKRSVDMWMDSFLHRIPVITPTGDRAGVGWHAGMNVTGALLDTRRGQDTARGRTAELHWPPDGMVGVPTSMSREQPNPTPYSSSDQAGYPVTCTFHPSVRVTESKGTLFQGNVEVPVFFSSPDQPTRHGRAMQQNTIALIPEKNLGSGKLHRVELSATVNGKQWTATWYFTTGARGKGFEWIRQRASDARMREALAAKKRAQDEARAVRDARARLALLKGVLKSVPDDGLERAIAEARAERATLPESVQKELDAALARAEQRLAKIVAARPAPKPQPKPAPKPVPVADGGTGKTEKGWITLLEVGKTPNAAWSTPLAPSDHWRPKNGGLHLNAKQMLVTLGYLNHTDDWTDYELKAEVQVVKRACVITRATLKKGEYAGNYLDLDPTPAGEWKTLHIDVSGGKVTLKCGSQTLTEDCETKAGGFVFYVDVGEELMLKNVRVKRPPKMK